MNSPAEFFAMGGYGLYVWGSFGMCALVLALEVTLLALRNRALRMEHHDQAADIRESGV